MNIDNKNQSKFLVDVNSLRAKYPRKELNPVRDGLRECGCTVTLEDRDDRRIMKICGNITESKVVSMFNKICEINVEPYFVTPGDWTNKYNSVNEKKKPCCPPKKKVNEVVEDKDKTREYLSLKECLNGKKQPNVNPGNSDEAVNRVIDIMSGKKLNESIADMAINKIAEESKKIDDKRKKFSNKVEKIIENMHPDVFVKVVENLEAGAKSMYSNVRVNQKNLSEYSCAELEAMVKKVNEQIETLAKKVSTMNEAEGLKEFQVKLDEKKRLQKILEYEITYRKAYEAKVNEADGEDDTNLAGIEFKDLNPGADENQDKKDDEKSDDDKSDDEEEQNPDEDEVEELSKIIITLSNEEAANNLRDDLIEAGIPEDVIEVAPADEADEEDEDETSDEGDGEEGGEATGFEEESDDELDDIFNNADNKAEESAKPKNSKNEEAEAINEADDEDAEAADGDEADAEAGDDAAADAPEGDDAEGEETDKQYNLILTDTDYVETFKKVLIDLWGVTEDEFVEMVGEIVTEDDDDDAESDEKSDEEDKPAEGKDGEKEVSDKEESTDDGLDFDPEEIFKGM